MPFHSTIPRNSIVAAGGVALNKAVIGHMEKLTGTVITVDPFAPLYGAIGAAMACPESDPSAMLIKKGRVTLLLSGNTIKHVFIPPWS